MLAYALCYTDDKPTFLIDANVVSPSLHIKENFSQAPGFADILQDNKIEDLESIAFSRNGLPLKFLASGKMPENPTLIYASPNIDSFLEKIRSLVSHAVFDMPPVHAYPEMALLARKLDGVVFVVRAHHTQAKSAILAIDKLRKSGVAFVGGVLNGKKYFIPKWLYKRL
jgi:Mrp family chromosome partitioning ATPase